MNDATTHTHVSPAHPFETFSKNITFSKKNAKTGFEYKQEYLFAKGSVDLFKGPAISADAVVGIADIHGGADVSYDVADAKVTRFNSAVAHSTNEYTVALQA